MIGRLFWFITLLASLILLIFLEAIAKWPAEYEFKKQILSYLILTFFTSCWGKLNNPDFEFKTFLKMIFLVPLRKQWMIRISFSYLIRIKVDDFYLLVRSGKKDEVNLTNKFQPVGGVYKMLSHKDIEKKFNLIDDIMKESPPDDLRKRLKNPFKIFKLLKWFHDKEGIEVAPFREFYEEVVKTKILPSDLFSNSLFHNVGLKKSQIVWSPWNKIYEYKIFEIYDLHMDESQLKFLRELKNNPHEDIIFLRRDDIRKFSGIETPWGFGITDHSTKILE